MVFELGALMTVVFKMDIFILFLAVGALYLNGSPLIWLL